MCLPISRPEKHFTFLLQMHAQSSEAACNKSIRAPKIRPLHHWSGPMLASITSFFFRLLINAQDSLSLTLIQFRLMMFGGKSTAAEHRHVRKRLIFLLPPISRFSFLCCQLMVGLETAFDQWRTRNRSPFSANQTNPIQIAPHYNYSIASFVLWYTEKLIIAPCELSKYQSKVHGSYVRPSSEELY